MGVVAITKAENFMLGEIFEWHLARSWVGLEDMMWVVAQIWTKKNRGLIYFSMFQKNVKRVKCLFCTHFPKKGLHLFDLFFPRSRNFLVRIEIFIRLSFVNFNFLFWFRLSFVKTADFYLFFIKFNPFGAKKFKNDFFYEAQQDLFLKLIFKFLFYLNFIPIIIRKKS